MSKFFVYGTLKIGGRFAASFDKVRVSSEVAKLKGFDLYGIGSGKTASFPGIVKGKGTVVGEIHEYPKDHLEEVTHYMDMIEGYSEKNEDKSLYLRRKAQVELEDGSTEDAYVYIFNQKIPDSYPLIEDGIWKI